MRRLATADEGSSGSKGPKALAAVLVAATLAYLLSHFVTRTPPSESPPSESPPQGAETQVSDGSLGDARDVDSAANSTTSPVGSSVAEEPSVDVSAIVGTKVLRVLIEGINEEEAPRTTVLVTGFHKSKPWPAEIRDSWPGQGLTSEFSLDPFFASVAEHHEEVHLDELEITVRHPQHFSQRARVPLSGGVELASGQTVYRTRVRFVAPEFWPEVTLAVRDAQTLAHLQDVELRCRTTAWMGLGSQPGSGGAFTGLGGGLSSPIVLLGGREADEPEERVAGLALRPPAGEAPQPAELSRTGRVRPERGMIVYARAPGYAWGSVLLDVSSGGERELLLGPSAALFLRFANVQLERYAELETVARLSVFRRGPQGGWGGVWSQPLDETFETDGLRLEGLEPGEYAVSVELGGVFSRHKRPGLAREEVSLDVGETGELGLALSDPPARSERATLGGVISFPAFGGEDEVRLKLYAASNQVAAVNVLLSLADLERVGGAVPTWSFRLDLPVGLYQLQLRPLQTSWMIELPAGGREDVELVIPELAEVLVETVDAGTGERIPLDRIGYRGREKLPGQVRHDWVMADFEGEPGRFRFWTAPGAGSLATFKSSIGLEYGWRRQELELVPGFQSVRFEFAPVSAIRLEFRDGEATLPYEDGIYYEVFQGIVRAVDHDGRATPLYKGYVRVSAPGVYEVNLEGIGGDRFHPRPSRRVDVRAGETTEVIVELRRK